MNVPPEPLLKRETSHESADVVSAISAIAYCFMGFQALFAALELGLFTTLSDEPGERTQTMMVFVDHH